MSARDSLAHLKLALTDRYHQVAAQTTVEVKPGQSTALDLVGRDTVAGGPAADEP